MPRKPPVRSDPPLDRGALLAALRDAGVPTSPEELARALEVKRRDQEAFAAALDEAVRAGDILVNRKGELLVAAKLDLVRGRVQGHPDGFGFLVPDAGGEDLFLSPREMHKALHGDRAAARVSGTDRRGRPEGEIVEVLERVNKQVVGRLHEARGAWFVEAEDRRLSQDILVGPEDRGGARAGEVVVLELTQQPSENVEAAGRVVEVLGSATDPGMEIEIALRKHALPFQFSEAAKAQAAALPRDVRAADRRGREDLRGLPLVTIDGETARDFDDAVYCERKGKGFRLVVAIADVSHYVRDGDALDRDARERGTSVYFPRRVIPMLPEELSNELCSLRPQVDRLCMVCDMDVAADGAIKRYRFYPAVMHSRARLTYTRVWQWLSNPAGSSDAEARALGPHLDDLYALYKVLAAAREARGAIDFDTVELALIFDDEGRIERIEPTVRNDAHRLIEECMLAANVCTADFLAEHKHAALYRVHEGPTPEKLEALRAFLGSCALSLGGGEKPQPADYAKLLAKIEGRPDQALLQTVLLRSLAQAQYHPDNVGHFGLAFDAYTHFTSPIRRYPDLTVHRAIKACLAGKTYVPKGTGWEALGAHCSMTERRADDATRDVERWLKCWFMKDRIGEEFDGTISGVAGFGIFVTLDGMNVDGLVHVTELGRDYFQFDKVRHALVGERSGRVYQLAGRVRVRVVRVDLETTKIDFVPVETEAPREVPVYSQPLDAPRKGRKPRR
jgi:ribonuclease R